MIFLNDLLDALHSGARLGLLPDDDRVELRDVALPRLREISVLVRLGEFWFGLNPLLLLGLSSGSARPLQSQPVFLEREGGL